MENSLLSATQVAAALNVDRSTVHRRIERGELTPSGYLGKRPLFTREDVERILQGEKAPLVVEERVS